jgi:hypothetical protein
MKTHKLRRARFTTLSATARTVGSRSFQDSIRLSRPSRGQFRLRAVSVVSGSDRRGGAGLKMDVMGWLTRFGRRMLMLLRHGQFDADLEKEMRLDQQLREQEQCRQDLSPEEADYAVQRRRCARSLHSRAARRESGSDTGTAMLMK